MVLPAILAAAACQPRTAPASEPTTPASPPAATSTAQVTGTAPPGAIVTLQPLDAPSPPPAGPAVMDQYSKQFVPDTLFARTGQTVEFRNSDDVDHNVQVLRMPTGTTVMNESGSKGQVFTHVFDRDGAYEVSCDLHPGMRAAIVVTEAPLAAVAGPDGAFRFAQVAPGRYTIASVSGGARAARDVVVAAPRTAVTLP